MGDTYRYAIDCYTADGRPLGQVGVEPDFQPAREWALFDAARRGLASLVTAEASGAVRLAERMLGLIAAMPFDSDNGETGRLMARAGYCAVPDFAEASIDAVEMLVRAASALRQAPADAGPAIADKSGEKANLRPKPYNPIPVHD